MVDFELNDMQMTYCKLEIWNESVHCKLNHYPIDDYWEWQVVWVTKEKWCKAEWSGRQFDTAEEAFDNMKRYINGLQS